MPSARRFASASAEWMNRYSLNSSATIRFISSGMLRSKLRSPASRWANWTPSFTATSATASVEFTSPGTITRSGRSSSMTGSILSITRAVWTAWVPEPTLRTYSGEGMPSSSLKIADIIRS